MSHKSFYWTVSLIVLIFAVFTYNIPAGVNMPMCRAVTGPSPRSPRQRL